ncbi:hypothetical protein [Brasilonema sp. UFV-L1]
MRYQDCDSYDSLVQYFQNYVNGLSTSGRTVNVNSSAEAIA